MIRLVRRLEDAYYQKKIIEEMCNKSMHIAILGKRETGKTSLGFAVLEWHHKLGNKECLIYNHPQPNLLPKWIRNITDIKQLTCNEILLIDESSNDFDKYSYAKQSNRFLMQKLKKARQLNISFIFIDHSSDFLNRNMLKVIDLWLLKKNTQYAIADERPLVRQMYERMERLPFINEFWLHTDEYSGMMEYEKPKWYTEDLAHAYNVHEMEVTKVDDLLEVLLASAAAEAGKSVGKKLGKKLKF